MSTSTVALTIEMPSLDASLSWNALATLVVGMSHELPARTPPAAAAPARRPGPAPTPGPAPRATCPPPATPTRSTTRTHRARASRSSGRQYWWTSAATPRSRRRFACSPTRSRAKFNEATRYRKFTRSWRHCPRARERGQPDVVAEVMTVAFDDLRAAGVATKSACGLTGRSRATHYRRLRPPRPRRPPIPQAERNAPTQAMTPAERAAVLVALNTGENADLSIGQVWVRELDEGRYWCSLSSMYRTPALPVRPGSDALRRPTRRRSSPNSSPTDPRRCGAGTSRNCVGRQGRVVPPVRPDRHLLAVQPRVDRLAARGLRARQGLPERGDPHQRLRPAHRARGSRHLDEVQTRVRITRRSWRHSVSLAPPCLE